MKMDSECKQTLFESQREPAACFYRKPTIDSNDAVDLHGSVENGSTSFYQNSRRPSSSSLQSALYGGIVTPDGKLHTYHSGTGIDEFEGFKSRNQKAETFVYDEAHNGGMRESQTN